MNHTTAPPPAWAINDYLELAGDRLKIDGADAVALVERHGSPLFVFSEPRIRRNVRRLRDGAREFGRRTKFCYAAKANSNMSVLAAVRDAGSDIEVNSGGELYKALRAGFRPDQIIFNGTSKTEEELAQAVEAGIYATNVDSAYELDCIARVAARSGRPARVALRVVPEVGTRSHIGLQTALLTSKFGIASAELPAVFRRALEHSPHVELCGIHLHVGSQTPDVAPFVEAFETTCRQVAGLCRETGRRLDHVNLGGGFPVDYLQDASHAAALPNASREMLGARLEPAQVFSALRDAADKAMIDEESAGLLDALTFVFEPGRSVVSDAGVLLTTVQNIKRRSETEETWLLTDAGYNLLLSMTSYKWYYHIVAAERAGESHDTPYKLAGPLCDSGDVYFDLEGGGRLPERRLLPRGVRPGEVLALLNAGAYTLSQASHYNGRPLPAAVMTRGRGHATLARRRDDYETLIAGDVWRDGR